MILKECLRCDQTDKYFAWEVVHESLVTLFARFAKALLRCRIDIELSYHYVVFHVQEMGLAPEHFQFYFVSMSNA